MSVRRQSKLLQKPNQRPAPACLDHATTLTDYLVEAAIILAVATVMFGPILAVKWLTIRRSKQRTLATDATAAYVPGTLVCEPSGVVSRKRSL